MGYDWQVEWLEPRYSGQKGFYKKARVETKEFKEGFTTIVDVRSIEAEPIMT